jgi:hypothetical protein
MSAPLSFDGSEQGAGHSMMGKFLDQRNRWSTALTYGKP